ncbi:phage Gp37/Gp68 family protein [bacterium]|nr:phage Gp37/Gp68 family protein [bacterium]
MAQLSKIEWTSSTWNPITGCSKISPGCANCYAERMAKRLKAMDNPSYANGFEVTLHERILDYPLKWKKPQMIFVNSMSDLFHKKVPVGFIDKIFDVMCRAEWHQFQLLTKRSGRMQKLNSRLPWRSNIWMGVSIENEDYTYRIEHLVKTNAKIKFLSLEPLIGPLQNLNLDGIDWVIVGGESGPKARPMNPEWVVDIRDQCLKAGVPFFFKQWGGVNKKKAGRILEDKTWDQMPVCV